MSTPNTTINVHKRPRTPDPNSENTFSFSVPANITRNKKRTIAHIEKRRKKDGDDPLLSFPLPCYDLKREGDTIHVVHKKPDTERLKETKQELQSLGDRFSALEETLKEKEIETEKKFQIFREELALLKQENAEWKETVFSYELWDRISSELKARLETNHHLLASRDAVDDLPQIWDVTFAIPLAMIYSYRGVEHRLPAPFWETAVDDSVWAKIRDWAHAIFRKKPSTAQIFVDGWSNLSKTSESSSDADLMVVCFLQHMLFKDARHGVVHTAPNKEEAHSLLQKMMKTPGCPAFNRVASIVQTSKLFG